MEILNDLSVKRTIIAALTDCEEGERFRSLLNEVFEVVLCHSTEECLQVMRERRFELSAAIVDAGMAEADDYAFLRTASVDPDCATIPVIVTVPGDVTDADAACLTMGAADIMTKPVHPLIAWRRVDNAVRMVRSTTFANLESMLCRLPSMIFLKDAEGR